MDIQNSILDFFYKKKIYSSIKIYFIYNYILKFVIYHR